MLLWLALIWRLFTVLTTEGVGKGFPGWAGLVTADVIETLRLAERVCFYILTCSEAVSCFFLLYPTHIVSFLLFIALFPF